MPTLIPCKQTENTLEAQFGETLIKSHRGPSTSLDFTQEVFFVFYGVAKKQLRVV